jgi:hypothetical protein
MLTNRQVVELLRDASERLDEALSSQGLTASVVTARALVTEALAELEERWNEPPVVDVARDVQANAPNLGYNGILARVSDRLVRRLTQAEQDAVYEALFARDEEEPS